MSCRDSILVCESAIEGRFGESDDLEATYPAFVDEVRDMLPL
jgi:hypothetical protein